MNTLTRIICCIKVSVGFVLTIPLSLPVLNLLTKYCTILMINIRPFQYSKIYLRRSTRLIMIFFCTNWNIMVLRILLINGSIAICRTDSSILNMGHTCTCLKNWKSRQGSLKVLSLDFCSSLSIWTTRIPYQIYFKQYCVQMTQRLRLLSVHLPVWWLVYKKYLVIVRLSFLISICGWQRTGFPSILIKPEMSIEC